MTWLVIVIAVIALALVIALGVLWLERGHKHAATAPAQPAKLTLDQAAVDKLQQELEAAYRQQIQDTTAKFAQDLSGTSAKLSEQVERLTTEVITTELEQYQAAMDQVRGIAAKAAEQIQAAMAQQQAGLQKAVEEAVAAERDRRLAMIDSRLSQIISSYLVESLGSGVDLGAQADYIIQSLEQRKDEIKKDLASGV
jgi:flagellar basal body-associated protein FliL